MAYIFFPPPQPTQAAPTVPIPAQGQQPPLGPEPALANLSVIRQAWEPPPPPPRQLPLTIVPLTFVYGQQPPLGANPFTVAENVAFASWPPPWWPAQSAFSPVVALTFTYGNQPPSYSAAPVFMARQLWEPPPPQVTQGPQNFAPLTLSYGQQPPPYSAARVYAVRQLWEPPDPPPQRDRGYIVPLTFTYGNQPPPWSPPQVAVAAWQPPWQQPQTLPGTAAWNVIVAGYVPYTSSPASILASWQPAWQQPPAPVGIAPLTLSYGSQPPRYSLVVPASVRQTWEPLWVQPPGAPPVPIPAQGQQPPLGQPPGQVNLGTVRQAWEPPPAQPQRDPGYIVPLTLSYGQAPPPYSSAAVFVVRQLWEPAPPQPTQGPQNFAPLTLSYGNVPPPYSATPVFLARQLWEPPPPMPTQGPQNFAPLTLFYGQQPPGYSAAAVYLVRQAWEPPAPGQGPRTYVVGGTVAVQVPIYVFFRCEQPMAVKAQALTVEYLAWNTSTNQPVAGDAANHTLRAVGDGVEFTPAASPSESDATNLKGTYQVALAAAEMNYNSVWVGGKSTTANVVLIPVLITTYPDLSKLLATSQINYTPPVVAQLGNALVVKGASYLAVDGRSLDWTDLAQAWPVLTGATITFTAYSSFTPAAQADLTVTGSVVTATGTAKKVRVELTAANTSTLTSGAAYQFKVLATLTSGDVIELISGTLTVADK